MGSDTEGVRTFRAPDPEPAGLAELLASLRELPSVRVSALWNAAAGPLMARQTRAIDLSGDLLRVECSSESWRAQVADLEAQLVSKLRQLGLDGLARLELSVSPRPAPAAIQRRAAPVPPERAAQIHGAVQGVQSSAVREALERLLLRQAQADLHQPRKTEGTS
jgi:hypothetical protein